MIHSRALAALILLAVAIGCSDSSRSAQSSPKPASEADPARSAPREVVLNLAAFSLAREPYENKIIPEFQTLWRKQHGQVVRFVTSFAGSGDQVRAIQGGLEADIAALSLAEDVEALVRSGLVDADWKSAPFGGIVSRSMVVLAVRKGNPHAIQDWHDLVRPGLRIVTPDPHTSGAGRWNVSAAYGAALRGKAGLATRDDAAAQGFLVSLLENVVEQERAANESFLVFASGVGDVALASESQVIRGRMFGNDYECVIPRSTLRIDNPVAVVAANADKHGVRDVAQAFRDFLVGPEAQRALAFHGARPVDPKILNDFAHQFPSPEDLWTIEDLGGWESVSKLVFGPEGVFERASKAVGAQKSSR